MYLAESATCLRNCSFGINKILTRALFGAPFSRANVVPQFLWKKISLIWMHKDGKQGCFYK